MPMTPRLIVKKGELYKNADTGLIYECVYDEPDRGGCTVFRNKYDDYIVVRPSEAKMDGKPLWTKMMENPVKKDFYIFMRGTTALFTTEDLSVAIKWPQEGAVEGYIVQVNSDGSAKVLTSDGTDWNAS